MTNPKVIACIIARTISTRLPLKVLRSVDDDNTMIEFIINRLKQVQRIDEIYICTSVEPVDDIMEDIATNAGIKLYRGSPDKVIERMLDVAGKENADIVLRITGDNVFTSYEYIDKQIDAIAGHDLDYVRLVGVPIGATAEAMRVTALKDCMARMDPSVSEYLMLFMFEPSVYRCGILKPLDKDYSHTTLTVDTLADLIRTRQILSHYHKEDKSPILLSEVISIAEKYDIPGFHMSNTTSTIKYPYGEILTVEEFSADMQRRKDQSLVITN
ncbi:MAG: cytidylyltransferase domain-containing protein [Ignavibacteria bacterium]